jgi:mRNA interferase YafQ
MLRLHITQKFKKEALAMKKRGKDTQKLDKIVSLLRNREKLPTSFQNHKLHGKYKNHSEGHIEPDWLLIYYINEEEGTLHLERTGTHADLF